jgi:assimilatory nitrate reductase catalytic subunit
MKEVRTTCPYCGVGCGIIASTDGSVRGDPDHPANYGRLCSKGSSLGETLSHEGRLLSPRIGGNDSAWDEALNLVAGKFSDAVHKHGPDSVAFYVSGQLLSEDYYVANKLMKGFIGSANIDTNSRLCMASSVAGHKRAFGTDTVPGQYEDLEQADLVVLVGSNLAWCHPVLYQRLVAAKEKRPDLTVVTVDPRRTATAEIADLVLQINADGDAALFNLLLCEISKRGLVDRDYTDAFVDGLEDALAEAGRSDVAETGLSEQDLARFLDLWCRSEKVVTVFSQGVNQSAFGTDKVNAILNCHLATGRIGRAGMGPFSVTGQPNAMGGREVGGLANMLACHLDIENPIHREAVQSFWNAPTIPAKQGLRAVDLFEACHAGKIKALWIMSTNPAVSMPNADKVRAAIRSVPFTVVSDIVQDTDTTRLADVLLPATGWGEKSGTITNSERCISRQRPFLTPPAKARADWDILSDVARRMGWQDAFAYDTEAEIFREYAQMSGLSRDLSKDFDISGLSDTSDAAYDDLAPIVWPVATAGDGSKRFFGDGGFYTPNGKAKMLPIVSPKTERTGLRLNTGRIRDQWHTMTRTGRVPRLGSHLAEPYLEIHPIDAASNGLSDADLSEVSTPRGKAILRVMVANTVPIGNPFAPMHWTDVTSNQGRVNALVAPLTDPISSQPALKGTPVSLQRFEAAWYGFLASESPLKPKSEYAAVARVSTGWSAEVAGTRTPENWEETARDLLGLRDGKAVIYADPAGGHARIGFWQSERLIAAMFAAPEPVYASRSYIVEQIGTNASPLDVLAGRPAQGVQDKGAIVCGCFNVGVGQIRRAISEGAATTHDLGACLGAGTNCGSCLPELKGLLKDLASQPLAAE